MSRLPEHSCLDNGIVDRDSRTLVPSILQRKKVGFLFIVPDSEERWRKLTMVSFRHLLSYRPRLGSRGHSK
jgi:hypothetical protein